jgi:hypothetical protein
MISMVPDDDDEKKLLELKRKIDRQITHAMHELGESGAETLGPSKYRLRNEGARTQTIREVGEEFGRQIKKWKNDWGTVTSEEIAPEIETARFFECLRERSYDLYENTNAWDTISALSHAAGRAITSQLEGYPAGIDSIILQAIRILLDLLDDDIAIFQGLNRGNNHSVCTKCEAAQRKTQELLHVLEPGGSSDRPVELAGGNADLRRELFAKADALRDVYGGIQLAAEALAELETAIRQHYDDHPVDAADGPGHWPHHQAIEKLDEASGRVRSIIQRLRAAQQIWAAELSAEAFDQAAFIASRLDPWESLLRSVAEAYRGSEPMRLRTVHIRYCFPFAVKVKEEEFGNLSSALKKRIPGAEATDGRAAVSDDDDHPPRLDSVLNKKLQSLYHGTATVGALKLADFWAGAGEGMYGGNSVFLPDIADTHHTKDKWTVRIDLSRLENHCLCIERTLPNPTPHELYKALRCPADYSRGSDYRYGWTGRGSGYWRGLDEFAHDVILCVAQGLTGREEPEYLKGHFHIIALVDGDTSITNLDGLYGAEILRTNVNRDAATLEEWVRYPIAERRGMSGTAEGNFGYKENWWSVLDDTTIFGVAGNPSWQADSYREAVQFAVSWTPRLLLWNRELMQALEPLPGEKKELSDLRELEQTVRRSVASAHAEELCRLRSDRRYLEWMMEAVGTTAIQEDLERRIHTMRLLITETEKKEQDRLDLRRNFFLGLIAIFGVLNVSTLFAVLDAGDSRGLFKSHTAITVELIVQLALFAVVAMTFVGVGRWRLKKR